MSVEMKYKICTLGVILITIIAVLLVYFVFGNVKVPFQGEIEIYQGGKSYEMDKEILSYEHSDPT